MNYTEPLIWDTEEQGPWNPNDHQVPIHTIAKFNSNSIRNGKEIHIVGHTIGMWWTYTPGTVSATRNNFEMMNEKKSKILQINSAAWMGNSGGGAFDEEGNLLGIISFVNVKVPNMTFFVHRDIILNFLKKNKIQYHTN